MRPFPRKMYSRPARVGEVERTGRFPWRAQVRLHLIEESACGLNEYALVPISFEVTERLDVARIESGIEGATLRARAVTPPYVKDYDLITVHRPTEWGLRWDLSKWRFVAAYLDGRRVGGAAVGFDTAGSGGDSAHSDVAVRWG